MIKVCFFVFLILFALLIFIIAYGLNCLGDMKGELKSTLQRQYSARY